MVNEFPLPRSGEKAVSEILDRSHLDQVLELHEVTRASLPAEQKMFVLPQSPDYFEKFLSGKSGRMVGITVEGKLIAQIVVMGPLSLEEAISRSAITRNDIAFHHVGAIDSLVAIKSMAVHPDFRGNELSQHLVTAALNMPLVQQADQVFAQISVNNTRSWELFLRNGFGVVAAAVDPGDNQPRFILQKPHAGFYFDEAPSADDVDPAADFPAIVRLTQTAGLIGRIDEDSLAINGLRLAFSASTELETPLPRVVREAE